MGESIFNADGLLRTLESDEAMREHDPPIDRGEDSERVEEEERNVIVQRAVSLRREKGG